MAEGQLIIVKGDKLVFSNYYRKPNGIPFKVDMMSLLYSIPHIGCLVIPTRTNTLKFLGRDIDPNVTIDVTDEDYGSLFFMLNRYKLSDYVRTRESKGDMIMVEYGRDTFYCRSDLMSLESAATAAGFVYDNPADIYEAVFKAAGYRHTPFVEIDLKDLSKLIDLIMSIKEGDPPADKETSKQSLIFAALTIFESGKITKHK